MGKPSKIKAFFQGLNKVQKATRKFLAKFIAKDVFKAENEARDAALSMVVPDFASRVASAEALGQSQKAAAETKIAEAQKALQAAQSELQASNQYLGAIALLKPGK